jgi:hypothetical protein
MQFSKVISTTSAPKTQSARFSRYMGTVAHRKRNDIRIQTRTIARKNENMKASCILTLCHNQSKIENKQAFEHL